MAKVPPLRGKGEPPAPLSIVGNLDKPESEALVSLNFRVPVQFRREFRLYAAGNDKDLVEVLFDAFAALKRENTRAES